MATYPPPSFQSTIFDSNAFTHTLANGGLSQAEADLLYYKYPLGQAYETLQQTDHTGLATFQAGIDLNAGTLQFPDNTTQTTAFTGSSSQTLSQTLVNGNSAGSTSINMNNQLISNCASVSGLQLSTGVVATNINIGNGNLNGTTTGGYNIIIGNGIATGNTTGKNNNMIGSSSGVAMTSGQGNNTMGSNSLNANTIGDFNIAMGNRAGEKNISGDYNVFLGSQAGQNGTAGTQNTFCGQASGQNDTGSNNSYLGCGTSIGGGVSNSTCIGIGATTSTANTIQLGRTSENVNCPNTLSVAGTITNTATQPAYSDSTTKVPTTAWVQGCILNQYGLGTNILYQPGTNFTMSSNVSTTLGSQSIGAGTWSISYSIGYNIDNSAVGQYATLGLSNSTTIQFSGKYGNATQTIWANNTNSGGILAFANGSTTLILTATTTIYFLGKVVYLGGVANLGALTLNSASFTRIG